MKKRIIALVTAVIMCVTMMGIPAAAKAAATDSTVGVTYRTYVQSYGWQQYASDGAESGTDGQSKRVEALNIKLVGAPAGASITYQAYVQGTGWQPSVSNGAEAGTYGQSKRIEAVRITLSGLDGYEVQYKVHGQTYGTTDWTTVTNGAAVANAAYAGTIGMSKRIEAVWIRIVKTAAASVVSSINPVGVSTIAGTAPDLPTIVTAAMSNGATKNYLVTWDSVIASQYANAGTFTVSGTISGSSTIKATATVTVNASGVSTTVKSITPLIVNTLAGTAPDLPSTVNATMADGTTKMYNVNWDSVAASQYAGTGTFTVNGTVSGSSAVKATAIVTVLPSATAVTVKSINPVYVTTIKGTAPDLPSAMTAVMSDGTTKNFRVTWVYLDSSQYANCGLFTVTGLIAANTTVEAKATVIVVTASTSVTAASVNAVSVRTIAGTAPDLPSTVTAAMSNGTTKNYSVTWDSVKASQYASAGTFTVSGTISGSSTIKATAMVTVE